MLLTRALWSVLALLIVGAYIAGLPEAFVQLQTPCGVDICPIAQLSIGQVAWLESVGIAVDVYAAGYLIFAGVTTVVWWAAAGIIFWRKSDDWLALLVALMLVLQGATTVTEILVTSQQLFHILNFLGWITLGLVFYLFPDGRFAPRWIRWLAIGLILLIVQSDFFPAFVPDGLRSGFEILLYFGFLSSILFVQVYRYRWVSGPVQRQQTKWVVFGVATYIIGGFVLALPLFVVSAASQPESVYPFVFGIGVPSLQLLIPLSFGVAILRSGLWDIDVIINRTLVYSTFTVALALIYVGCVVLLRQLFAPLTGSSEVAIVASTLAIAALFNPLRRRIQNVIDKRFYRRKYEATKVLAAFGATARDETNLDALTAELVRVVDETMQPEFVSLWLRDPQAHNTTEATRLDSTPPG
jgi:hypothetical protein